jgi:hypothetical protein
MLKFKVRIGIERKGDKKGNPFLSVLLLSMQFLALQFIVVGRKVLTW